MEDFDEWYARHVGFFTGDAYSVYKEYSKESPKIKDLEYLESLRRYFSFWPIVFSLRRGELNQASQTELSDPRLWSSLKRRLLLSRSEEEELLSSPPPRHHMKLSKWVKAFVAKDAKNWFFKTGENLSDHDRELLEAKLISYIKADQRKDKEKEARIWEKRKGTILEEYFPPKFPKLTLNRPDRSPLGEWDSFFLLATSEYFRKTTKDRKPHFRWAAKLLKTINPKFHPSTANAKNKTSQLQKRHQQNWKSHLKELQKDPIRKHLSALVPPVEGK